MLSGEAGQSDDGVAMDADESSGGADAAALVEMVEHRVGLLLGQMAAVERRALAFGGAGPAGVAVELSELLVLAESAADREVAGVASPVERTVRVLAAEAREVVHGVGWRGTPVRDEASGWKRKTAPILRRIPHHGSTELGHHRLRFLAETPGFNTAALGSANIQGGRYGRMRVNGPNMGLFTRTGSQS
jgi:hypothetical protein